MASQAKKAPAGKGDKLTAKQEAFAQAYVETGSASEAYRRAYDAARMKPATVNRNASAALKNNKIATRVAELQSVAAEKHEITLDSLVAELEEARQIALSSRTAAAAVSATLGKAKLLGFMVEKHEHTGKDGGPIETKQTIDLSKLTDNELEAYRIVLAASARNRAGDQPAAVH